MSKYIDAGLLRKEIEFAKSVYGNPKRVVNGVADAFRQDGRAAMCDDILKKLDTLPEQPVEGLEEEVKKYWNEHALDYRIGRVADLDFMFLCARHFYELGQQSRPKVSDSSLEEEIDKYFQGWSNDDEYGDALMSDYTGVDVDGCKNIARHFAEWGEKNAYKAIMKKADEVRDKRFDTDYEVKFEPAAGFDLVCVNVYHEGKLVGQYIEPKKEKKLPEGLEKAAEEYGKRQGIELKPFAIKFFKAGAEYGMNQMFTIKYDNEPLDSAARKTFEKWIPMEILEYNGLQMPLYNQGALIMMFDAGAKWDRAKMMEGAVECDVIVPIYEGNNVWSAKIKIPGRHEPGDKVKVIIIPDEK